MTLVDNEDQFKLFLREVPDTLRYKTCISCNATFSSSNTHTAAGWCETQISGMCENCFDSLFTEEGE